MAVLFPESMNRLDAEDSRGSFFTIDSYIRYMQERLELADRNINRQLSQTQTDSQSAWEELQKALAELTARVEALEADG